MNFDFDDFDFDFDFEKKQKVAIPQPATFQDFIFAFAEHEKTGYNYNQYFYKRSALEMEKWALSDDKPLFLFEAPPRSGKTELQRLFFARKIATECNKNFLFVFGSNITKKEYKGRLVEILNSSYFKMLYGDTLSTKLENNQTRVMTTKGNVIIFLTSFSQAPTGMGFHYIVFVDYFTQRIYDSTALRSQALKNSIGFLTRKQHNPPTKFFVDNQRLGLGDLTEILVKNYAGQNIPFIYLQFPYIFKDEWSSLEKRNYGDYIYDENQFLTDRFSVKTMKQEIADLGSENLFEIQFQGVVDGLAGEIFEENDFAWYDNNTFYNTYFTNLVIVVDTALKNKEENDYSVIALWGFNGKSAFLIDIVQGKWLADVFETQLELFLHKWRNGVNGKLIPLVKIEDTAIGSISLNAINHKSTPTAIRINELTKQRGVRVEGYKPSVSKYQRLSANLRLLKEHKLYLPSNNFTTNVPHSTVMAFKQQAIEFTADDRHQYDDMVDTMITALEHFYVRNSTIKIGFEARY